MTISHKRWAPKCNCPVWPNALGGFWGGENRPDWSSLNTSLAQLRPLPLQNHHPLFGHEPSEDRSQSPSCRKPTHPHCNAAPPACYLPPLQQNRSERLGHCGQYAVCCFLSALNKATNKRYIKSISRHVSLKCIHSVSFSGHIPTSNFNHVSVQLVISTFFTIDFHWKSMHFSKENSS